MSVDDDLAEVERQLADEAAIAVAREWATVRSGHGTSVMSRVLKVLDERSRERDAAHAEAHSARVASKQIEEWWKADRAELERLRGALERAEDALAEAAQEQTRMEEQRAHTEGCVVDEIVGAGLAGYVCDDDDLPDMVRHALAAAKKLAQPALWTYNDRGEAENQAAPVDWAPRFRAASAAASQEGFDALAAHFAEAAEYLQLPGRAEAVERALIGEDA